MKHGQKEEENRLKERERERKREGEARGATAHSVKKGFFGRTTADLTWTPLINSVFFFSHICQTTSWRDFTLESLKWNWERKSVFGSFPWKKPFKVLLGIQKKTYKRYTILSVILYYIICMLGYNYIKLCYSILYSKRHVLVPQEQQWCGVSLTQLGQTQTGQS